MPVRRDSNGKIIEQPTDPVDNSRVRESDNQPTDLRETHHMKELGDQLAGGQIKGKRNYQEDHFQISLINSNDDDNGGLLLVLTDGMGGHVGGGQASKLVISTYVARFEKESGKAIDRLRTTLEAANAAISEAVEKEPLLSRMGCTLVACFVSGNVLYWLSVGDSPLWLSRSGELLRLNEDHSMRPVLDELVESGRMSAVEAANDVRANQLRSAVFGDEISIIDQNTEGFTLKDGDFLLLASDGLEVLSVNEIQELVEKVEGGSAKGIVTDLLKAVEEKKLPKQDNATVIAYRHDMDGSIIK